MTRTLFLVVGLVLLAVLWLGPLPAVATTRFSAHMLLHIGVVAVAAPFLALGTRGGPLDPAWKWPAAMNPIAASVFELLVVWGWHAPLFHHAARQRPAVFVAEQLSFLVAGLWLWLAACGGRPADARRAWSGVAALLFTAIHMTLLGALFALAPRGLYAHGDSSAAVADLHLGGSAMLLIGGASYLCGGLWLAFTGLRDRALTSEGAA